MEALARSGIGQLTLVDLDDVCISNVNRQLHALTGTFGNPKVEAMAARVQPHQSRLRRACATILLHREDRGTTSRPLMMPCSMRLMRAK